MLDLHRTNLVPRIRSYLLQQFPLLFQICVDRKSAFKGFKVGTTMDIASERLEQFVLIEFNLVRYTTHTPIGYHALPVVELLIFFCLLPLVDAELSVTARGVLRILTLLSPSIFLSVSGFIF